MATVPYEMVMGPIEVYTAPVGTAFPQVDTDPATPWELLGTSGSRNITEDGVTVTHSQDVTEITPFGSTGPVKAVRTSEGLKISFTLMDLTAAVYAKALNNGTVTDTAAGTGTPGTSALDLMAGADVAQVALLAKGSSPAGDGFSAQYQVPVCYQSASPEVVFSKGAPAGLKFEFTALEDPNASSASERFGSLVIQTAAAS